MSAGTRVGASGLQTGGSVPAVVRVGTRRSRLARTQTGTVAERLAAELREAGLDATVEIVEVTTHGDTSTAPLASIGGTGVFVSALRTALHEGRIDVAVHSLKDLPTYPEDGVTLAALPGREDPRDALVARDCLTVDTLPAGARVGTGSPRRAAQLRARRPDLQVVDIRGNVDTRMAMVTGGRMDAVVLAVAGLRRLGRHGEATEVLDPAVMLPAPGQGALAIEARTADAALLQVLAGMDDAATRACVTAERSLLAALEAGCSAPVGALAMLLPEGCDPTLEGGTPMNDIRVQLDGAVGSVDGTVMLRETLSMAWPHPGSRVTTPPDPSDLGRDLAELLLKRGAADLVPAATGTPTDPAAPAREGEP